METIDNLYRTIEADAWSRDFDYENYLLYHANSGVTSRPLSKKGWKLICTVFNQGYEETVEDGEGMGS